MRAVNLLASCTVHECGCIHTIILVIILYSVVNYYDMLYAVTILDIYYVCNYSLGACLLNLVTCASIASCLGGRCVCAIFLGMVSGSSK